MTPVGEEDRLDPVLFRKPVYQDIAILVRRRQGGEVPVTACRQQVTGPRQQAEEDEQDNCNLFTNGNIPVHMTFATQSVRRRQQVKSRRKNAFGNKG